MSNVVHASGSSPVYQTGMGADNLTSLQRAILRRARCVAGVVHLCTTRELLTAYTLADRELITIWPSVAHKYGKTVEITDLGRAWIETDRAVIAEITDRK